MKTARPSTSFKPLRIIFQEAASESFGKKEVKAEKQKSPELFTPESLESGRFMNESKKLLADIWDAEAKGEEGKKEFIFKIYRKGKEATGPLLFEKLNIEKLYKKIDAVLPKEARQKKDRYQLGEKAGDWMNEAWQDLFGVVKKNFGAHISRRISKNQKRNGKNI